MSEKQKSYWTWIGCGCVGLVALVIGGVIAATIGGGMFVSNYVEELQDPTVRAERARQILGTDELPAGFEPQIFFRVPWLFDMVAISDGEPAELDEDGNAELEAKHLGRNAFIFISMRDMGDTRADLEAVLAGEKQGLDNVEMDFRSREALGHGEVDAGAQHVRWAAHRGEYRDRHEDREGVYAVLVVDCPEEDGRVRFAFYWQQRTDPEGEAADLSGSPADEATIAGFVSHFNLCGS